MSAVNRTRIRSVKHAVFWALVGVASFVLGVQSSIGQRAEESVLNAAEFTTNPPAPLNLLSEITLLAAFVVIGIVALATYGWRRAVGVAAASAAALVASQLLKLRVLERPQLLDFAADNTFPSGHMTAFTVFVAALIWVVPAAIRSYIALGGAALLSVVAWQLLAYGWHRPSDVFGGIALGVLAFALVSAVKPLTTGRPAVLGRLAATGLIMSAFAIIAGALILLVIAVVQQHTSFMLLAGQLGAVGICLLASRSVMLLAEPRN